MAMRDWKSNIVCSPPGEQLANSLEVEIEALWRRLRIGSKAMHEERKGLNLSDSLFTKIRPALLLKIIVEIATQEVNA